MSYISAIWWFWDWIMNFKCVNDATQEKFKNLFSYFCFCMIIELSHLNLANWLDGQIQLCQHLRLISKLFTSFHSFLILPHFIALEGQSFFFTMSTIFRPKYWMIRCGIVKCQWPPTFHNLSQTVSIISNIPNLLSTLSHNHKFANFSFFNWTQLIQEREWMLNRNHFWVWKWKIWFSMYMLVPSGDIFEFQTRA